MPHVTLEHTNNVMLPEKPNELLLAIHRVLNETGGIKIGNCKSRIYRVDHFLIAENQREEGFVHLDIIIGSGRSNEKKAAMSQQCLELLKDAFLSKSNIPVQITVNVGEIPLELYSKYPEGTLNYQ